ncbi:hydantoinase/oxoprolinase N-terminal domain-containing protein [Sphingopyxis sp.]|uniref:hydantoinase/oxoprolinase N-terminal domain-containing protein n=1 Tax=Sphingopyxis sp. TaxID=1908224 RepID=UPI003D6CD98F
MRIGVDVGGTNTDAVLIAGGRVVASTKQPTSVDVSSGVTAAIGAILADAGVLAGNVGAVMIGTTHFTNALVERDRLDRVGIIRLASPSGEALPPMTGWPEALATRIAGATFLLPGGYEVDGREISPLDEAAVRAAARDCREQGIGSIAVSCAFAPINAAMEEWAAAIIADAHPDAHVSLSHNVGRLGLIERENGTILNAALASLAQHVMTSLERALAALGITAPLYISQNDGTLISAAEAARYPVLTIGSGPTNSMRGAAFLTGVDNGIVMDVGGTTCDIGVLANGYPRESSIAVDIGGVRTNFRMPDILAIGLGGGTRIHLSDTDDSVTIGPDSVGFRLTQDACLFGGSTLTTSDIAVAAGKAHFGDPDKIPALAPSLSVAILTRMADMLADGIDRMKTQSGDVTIIAVGGGHFLIDDDLKGAANVVRPDYASVANAVGAAIAQVGAQTDRIIDYDAQPRAAALEEMRETLLARVVAAGATRETAEIVDMDEVFLSYLPGRSAQLRMKAVGSLADAASLTSATLAEPRHVP